MMSAGSYAGRVLHCRSKAYIARTEAPILIPSDSARCLAYFSRLSDAVAVVKVLLTDLEYWCCPSVSGSGLRANRNFSIGHRSVSRMVGDQS